MRRPGQRGHHVEPFCCYVCGPVGGRRVDAAIATYGGFAFEPDWVSAFALNTQPDIDDGDMEDPGVSARWVLAGGGAVLSKDNTDSYSGAQCLKQTPAGGYSDHINIATIVGNQYEYGAALKSDSAGRVLIFSDQGAWVICQTATGGIWEYLTGDYEWVGGLAKVQLFNSGGTNPGKLDDLTLANLSITTYDARLASAAFAGIDLVTASAANMLWKTRALLNGRQTMSQKTTDLSASSLAASVFTFLHYTANTVFFAFKPSALSVADLWYTGTLVTQRGVRVRIGLTGMVSAYVYNASGTALHAFVTTHAVTAGAVQVVAVRFRPGSGLDVWLNGAGPQTQAPTGSPSSSAPAASLTTSQSGTAFAGERLDLVAIDGDLSDAEVDAIGAEIAARWGGTW